MNKQFATRDELFDYLRRNKSLLIEQKKSTMKQADAIEASLFTIEHTSGEITKAAEIGSGVESGSMPVTVVINTTNIMDSHSDVHLPGLWKKSLSENKNILFLQEHKMEFEKVISDKPKAFTRTMSWDELGFKYPGITQALIFTADIEKDRNEFMFNQYAKGRVKNHSVGMRYVTMLLAMNSESKYDIEEKAVYDIKTLN